MNRIHPRFWRGIQALAAASPDFFVGGADIVHPGILIIAQPENFMNVLRQLAKTLLAFPQSLLCPLVLGNVARDTEQTNDRSGGIAQRALRGEMDSAEAVRRSGNVFIRARFARFDYGSIALENSRQDLAGKQLRVVEADHFLR